MLLNGEEEYVCVYGVKEHIYYVHCVLPGLVQGIGIPCVLYKM